MPPRIPELIDKRDNVEIVRDQIAAILKVELAHQQTLTTQLQPRVFLERSNPWGDFLEVEGLPAAAPIINVWFDGETFDGGASNIVERQTAEGTFNVDCYGYGVSVDDGEGGQIPGDLTASLEAQRAARLARNILMAGVYTYLGMRGVVGKRWPQTIQMFQPQLDNRAAQRVVGARLALAVRYNEFSPQFVGEQLETLLLEVRQAGTGELFLRAEYPRSRGLITGAAALEAIRAVGSANVRVSALGVGELAALAGAGAAKARVVVTGGASLAAIEGAGAINVNAFQPNDVSAVVGWLRVANATVTDSGVSSLPDVLGGSAATQATDARRPALGTSGNGLPIMSFTDDYLVHPMQSGVNGSADFFGIALWLRSPLNTTSRTLYVMRAVTGGTSAHRGAWQIAGGEDVLLDLNIDNSNARRLRTPVAQVGDNVWQFWTCEFQGSLVGDARCTMTRNNSAYVSTFSGQGPVPPSEMPATLVAATGNALLGAASNVPGTPFTGDVGPNIYFLNRQLTTEERANLMAFEAPN